MSIEKIQTTDNPDFDFNIANSDLVYKGLKVKGQNFDTKVGNNINTSSNSTEEMDFDNIDESYDNYNYKDFLDKINQLNLSDATIPDITTNIYEIEKRVLK